MNANAGAYLGCMLAQEYEPKRVTFPVAVEDKLDGLRITHVGGAGYTRNGKTYESFAPFSKILHSVVGRDSIHVDTEMMASNWNETSKLLKRIKNVDHDKIRAEVGAYVFDVFSPETVGVEEYTARRTAVNWIVQRANELGTGYKFETTHATIAHSYEDLERCFTEALGRGREGLMIKPLDGVYVLKRSFAWLKRKPWKDITVTIVGAEHGWGYCRDCMADRKAEPRADCPACDGGGELAYEDELGAFVCRMEDGQIIKCGMGFNDAQKFEFWADRLQLLNKKIDVKVQVDPGTNQISARHPVFQRRRPDLDA
jgi:ATP-dependent DNA ligase